MPKLDLPRLKGDFMVFNGVYPFKNTANPELISMGPGVNAINAEDPNSIARTIFGSTSGEWLRLNNINIAIDNIFNIPFGKTLEKAAENLRIDENGGIIITAETIAYITTLPNQLIQRVKKIKFAEDAVDVLNTPKSNQRRTEFVNDFHKFIMKTAEDIEIDLDGVVNGTELFHI